MVESGCLFQINHREKKAFYNNIDQMFWSTIWSIFYNNIDQMFWSTFDQYCYKKLFFFSVIYLIEKCLWSDAPR